MPQNLLKACFSNLKKSLKNLEKILCVTQLPINNPKKKLKQDWKTIIFVLSVKHLKVM